jgi:hypothetical protein
VLIVFLSPLFRLDYQYNPKGVNYKKKIPITHNLRLLKINCKEYKGYGLVYNFMLEEVLDYGPSNVGKFGSTYRPVLDLLWNRLKDLILKKRKEVCICDGGYLCFVVLIFCAV